MRISHLVFVFLVLFVVEAHASVSLKEKIGQMLLIGFEGSEVTPNSPIAKAILNKQVGGVILFDYKVASKSFDHNIKNRSQLRKLTSDLQQYAKVAADNTGTTYLPLLIAIDYEGGKVNRLKENYGFPKTLSAAEVNQLDDAGIERYAIQMAETLNDVGINFNFAPVVDVNINPDSPAIGRLGRSFSADPARVSEVAAIFSKAFKNHRIICSYKHFPGHGSANGDTHQGFVDVTQTWQNQELLPYQVLLKRGDHCDVVMSAHVVNYRLDKDGYPATLSRPVLTDLLRTKLGYHGIVVTDDMQMRAIADHYGLHEALRLTINAGADLIIFANQQLVQQQPQELINFVYEDVQKGLIPKQRIEQAYKRIIGLKQKLI